MSKANPYLQDAQRIQQVLTRATVLHIAYIAEGQPQIVPVSFGYQNGTCYFHSSLTGQKMQAFRLIPQVAFECQLGVELIPAEQACQVSVRYQSVIGRGNISLVEDVSAKEAALICILRQHGITQTQLSPASLQRTAVLRLQITSCSYKQSPLEEN